MRFGNLRESPPTPHPPKSICFVETNFQMTYSFAPIITQPLSDVISYSSVPHHMFVGDTELYKSDSSFEAFTLARIIESCISHVKV